MSLQVNVYEAKTHFSSLLSRLVDEGEIIIARAGEPIAKLTPIKKQQGKRKLGRAKGKIWIADDFNAPLPESILKTFEQ